MNPSEILMSSIRLHCENIPTMRLVAVYNVITAGWDPKERDWYSEFEHMFTENGGTKMHTEMQRLFEIYVMERINNEPQ